MTDGDWTDWIGLELPDLMGAKEAAAELDVKVPNLRLVPGIPQPKKPGQPGCEYAQQLASGPVWNAEIIRRIARRRRAERLQTQRAQRMRQRQRAEKASGRRERGTEAAA